VIGHYLHLPDVWTLHNEILLKGKLIILIEPNNQMTLVDRVVCCKLNILYNQVFTISVSLITKSAITINGFRKQWPVSL